VTNADDGSEHTVTSEDFSVAVDGGASEMLTIAEAGTYDIRCNIHPAMTGTITVE
jgi:plastocyanin